MLKYAHDTSQKATVDLLMDLQVVLLVVLCNQGS